MGTTESPTRETRFQIPHIFIVLFGMMLLAAAATWFLPSGEYQRTEGPDGRMAVVEDSFQAIDSQPAGLLEILTAVPRGLVDSSVVVFAVLIIGGVFGVIGATRTIELGLGRFTDAFKHRPLLMIPIVMAAFAVIASLIGVPELSLVYIPIILSLAKLAGWNALTAAGITLVGVTAGFATAIISPFSVGLAQEIAGVPVGSGIGYRLIVMVAVLGSGIAYTMLYVRKITRRNTVPSTGPTAITGSTISGLEDASSKTNKERANWRHAATGMTVVAGLGVFVYGVVNHEWFLLELSGVFLAVLIVVSLLHRLKLNTIANEFTRGCESVLVGALVVGFARAVALILEDGRIMDTIIASLSVAVEALPSEVTAVGMLVVQNLINFVIPSSSGQAVIAMPIMAPLADLVGVTPQTAVLAFQIGDGMSNIIVPTSGYFMATLAMARVPYQDWLRFFAPLFGIWLVIGALALVVAQSFGW